MIRLQFAAFVIASAAATATFATDTKDAAATADARPDDVVCTYERTVGSNLKRRVCDTRSSREKRGTEDREAMDRLRRSRGAASASSNQ